MTALISNYPKPDSCVMLHPTNKINKVHSSELAGILSRDVCWSKDGNKTRSRNSNQINPITIKFLELAKLAKYHQTLIIQQNPL